MDRALEKINSTKQHAVSLVETNEELEGFGVGPLMFALNRYHDKKDVVKAVEQLFEEDRLMTNGRAVFVVESEDE